MQIINIGMAHPPCPPSLHFSLAELPAPLSYTVTTIASAARINPCLSAGLSLTQKKKNPVQNRVISKEPADSTCLHPGVPNCSTMSP